uniref:Uncharacterized protein n=1 Tax=Panagrolaimus superbus TaxID=310955 RepID=A0A914Y452_9BILA
MAILQMNITTQQIYNDTRFYNLEEKIGYTFRDRSFLIQAFTHASFTYNRVTGCYQRLEFLGDAVLDYLITRYLFEHGTTYSPGVLTDLRSALVNNVIFASLAVKYNMQKYLLVTAPPLISMIERFVELHKQKGEVNFNDDMFMVTEDEVIEGAEEDVEVPKALGDIFESLAGAIYLDCDMDLRIVWRVFYDIMKETIERCCRNPPQSPIRELFEMKSHKVRFTKVERLIEKSGARVTVDIDNGKLSFSGVGRSYRIAKTTAAKNALRYLRSLDANKEQEQKS